MANIHCVANFYAVWPVYNVKCLLFQNASKCQHYKLRGLQFHINKMAEKQASQI